ncbi:MAG: transcription termination/antitermination protein NusG [Pirellulales bacterium]
MSDSEKTAPVPAPMDWYILKVSFNREDGVRDALVKRIKMNGMESSFGEILIPTEDVVTFTRNGTRRVVKRKLYPGYLMIYMSVSDDSWFLVRETPGVGDYIGSGGKPTPMDPHDVERIIKSVRPDEEGEQALKTAIPFRVGDRVRVKEGYFQNLEGDVEKVDEANGRITVMISIFGRSTPVELDHWQVEAV